MIDEAGVAQLREHPELANAWVNDIADTLEVLLNIRKAAEEIIYRPRQTYAEGSKKAKLKEALDRFSVSAVKEGPTQEEKGPVPLRIEEPNAPDVVQGREPDEPVRDS